MNTLTQHWKKYGLIEKASTWSGRETGHFLSSLVGRAGKFSEKWLLQWVPVLQGEGRVPREPLPESLGLEVDLTQRFVLEGPSFPQADCER